jgi:signal transduction histidine kinase
LAVGVGALIALADIIVLNRLQADIDATLLREADAYAAAVGSKDASPTVSLLDSSRDYLAARGHRPSSFAPLLLVKFADGRIVSNSEVALEQAPGNAAALDIAKATREFGSVTYGGQTYRTATVPVIGPDGKVQAIFQAAVSQDQVVQIAQQVGWTLVLVGVAIVFAGAGLSALIARGALAPLHEVAHTAQTIGTRSLSQRVEYKGPNDDVGRMVTAFNGMLDRLETAFGEQRRFVADASHELRTPLTIVRGHLDVLAAAPDGDLTEEQHETLDLVADELSRMSRLVEDLLALARLESGQRPYQNVDVCMLAHTALEKATTLGDRRFGYRGWTCAWVRGDPDQLSQALLNLLSNAVSHTSPGGEVLVTCTQRDRTIVIDVADDGPGIRTEDLPRVFDRFYRSGGPRPSDTGGSGLGLAITKRLVELHGGTVGVANREFAGAVFSITLPLAPAAGPQRPPGAPRPDVAMPDRAAGTGTAT